MCANDEIAHLQMVNAAFQKENTLRQKKKPQPLHAEPPADNLSNNIHGNELVFVEFTNVWGFD